MREYLRSFRWIDYYFLALTEPRKLAVLFPREEKASFAMGFITLALVALFDILSVSLLGRQTSHFYDKISYGWLFSFILLALQVAVLASLIDAACQLMGKGGNVKKLVALLSFALFPRTLLLPLVFIVRVLNFAPYFFFVFFSLGLTVWSALIAVQGIAEINSLGTGRSLTALLLPFVFVGLSLFFLALLGVLNLAGYLSSM